MAWQVIEELATIDAQFGIGMGIEIGNMIKIKLFDAKKPTEIKELELTSEMMINGECLIGSSPDCGIVLPSFEVNPIHGSICFLEGQYYFTDYASQSGSQFNDEDVNANQKYLLNIDDIVRLGEFVLIIVAVPLAQKTKKSISPDSKKTTEQVAPLLPRREYMSVPLLREEYMSVPLPRKEYMSVEILSTPEV